MHTYFYHIYKYKIWVLYFPTQLLWMSNCLADPYIYIYRIGVSIYIYLFIFIFHLALCQLIWSPNGWTSRQQLGIYYESIRAHISWFSSTASSQCQLWPNHPVSTEEKNAIEPILFDNVTQVPKRNALQVLNHVTDAPLCHGSLQEVGGTARWKAWARCEATAAAANG